MEQATSTRHGGGPNPLDSTGLCLLSLDGGGVRGLSTLYILKSIMDRLNHERKQSSLPAVKPCEVFDLIGGTSTGGLIAIMLGRLEMDVDECIAAYSNLAAAVFGKKRSRMPFNIKGKVKARFDFAKLKSAVQETVKLSGASETDLLNDGTERGCRTFVCAVDHDTKDIVRLRSYSLPHEPNIRATICQSALATSAATTFFDPVTIGNRTFADGGLDANNPVDEVEGEASNIWCSETGDLKPLVKCFVSIGTGNPGKKAFEDSMIRFLSQTVVEIATETENTEKKFIARWAKHFDEKRYFRFNVDQGLQNIGLNEYKKKGAMEAATEGYLTHMAQKFRVGDCIQNLKLKQSSAATNLAHLITEYNVQRMIQLRTTSRTEVPWVVPFQRNPQFVGRSLEIGKVDAMLFSETRCERVAIVGLGGVGKTQIALEFAHQLRERQPDYLVFWIPVTNVESMLEAYLEIGQQLQIPNLEQEKADVQKLVQRRLSQESSGRWLLVFDNADDTDMWMERANNTEDLGRRIDYLPKSKHGSILFTTRSRKAATKLAGKNVVSVGEMDETMAKDLLKKSLIDQDLFTSDRAAADLLQKLTNLPLAIVQAAAYINENQITLSEYAALLDDTEQNIINLLSEEFEDEGRYQEIKNPVATTWLISFEQIRTRDPLAAEYLSFMSCVNAKDIPKSLLPPAESAKKAVEALGTLSAYSFITEHRTDPLLDLHRLVHLATRNWLRMKGSRGEWAAKALERLEEVFPDSDHINRSVWRMYLPHAQYALEFELEEDVGNGKTELLWKFGKCAHSDGRYKEAEKAFAQVMQIRKRVLGEEHLSTLTSMANLASTYRNQGRWKEAEELFVQVMETRKRVLGEEHLSTLTSMANLASTYRNQGRWKEAEELEVQVMETSSRVLGEEHPSTLTSMANLASTYRNQGRWKEAEELEVQVMETSSRVLGEEHPSTLTSMANLASTYRNQGRWKEAEELFVQVMETRKRVLGEEHPSTLTSMANLASTFWNQGRWKEAEELQAKELEICSRVLGAEHPDTLTSMANLASTYRNQGRWKEAEELFVQVMETRKRVLGEEHPDTLTSMNNLASTWKHQGRHTEAFKLMEECVKLQIQIMGANHPHTLSSSTRLTRWQRENLKVGALAAENLGGAVS
ncbi:FabD/lysophospholipase-like protein [Zopfia rhizophila CBS 207.26]|uniref:FabD/lysophospholipase-like protein n=1 Tax=Zopfia rhizophila CBS 207.26 TaxID=1314779 RepID=A0A6A6EE96_9PEZI|nr:FabD/lysophospholipase-like protein [Zopfia rhizophila CBS 207.26]